MNGFNRDSRGVAYPFPSRPVLEDFPDTLVLELSLASISWVEEDCVVTGLKNTASPFVSSQAFVSILEYDYKY